MQDQINKINLWWKKFTTKEPVYEKKSLKPSRDWAIMLSTSIIVIVLCGFVAFYFYVQVDSGEFFAVSSTDSPNEVKVNNKLLQETVADIKTRQENFERTKLTSAIPKDPSR